MMLIYNLDEDTLTFLRRENPLPFMLAVARKEHVGDEAILALHILSSQTVALSKAVQPVHIYTIGKSGKGKSHGAKCVLGLLPEEYTQPLGSFSPKAFYYASQNKNFDKKIIHCPEISSVGEKEETFAMLRMLTDSTNQAPVHFTVDDKRRPIELKLDGRHALWFNSETPLPDGQLKNRVLLCNPNESTELDKEVFNLQVQTLGLLQDFKNPFIEKMQIINLWLFENDGWDVFVPFAKDLEFSESQNRRLFPLFLTLLKAHAKLNMERRQQIDNDGFKFIVAEPEDLYVTQWVFDSIVQTTLGQVSQQALNALEKVPSNEVGALTINELAVSLSWNPSWTGKKLRELFKAGLVSCRRSEGKGGPLIYWASSPNYGQPRTNFGLRSKSPFNPSNSQNEALWLTSDLKTGSVASGLVDWEDYKRRVSGNSVPSWLECLKSGEKLLITHLTSDSEVSPKLSEVPGSDKLCSICGKTGVLLSEGKLYCAEHSEGRL